MHRLILIPFLMACGNMTEDEFFTSYAQEKCAYSYSCVSEDIELDQVHGSQEECAVTMEAELKSNIESNDLVFQSSQAADCLAYLDTLECNAEPNDDDPCNFVWTIQE